MSKARVRTNGHNRFEPNTLPKASGYRSAVPVGYWWQNYQKRPMWSLWQADMMTTDYQVAIGLAISDAPLYAAEVEVQSNSQYVVDFIGKQWDRIWSAHAWQILMAKRFGFMGYEVNYVERNGLIEFDSINDFHPRDTRPVINELGLFVGINVRGRRWLGTEETDGVAALRGPKALWIRYDYRHNDFYGRSCLEKAYAPWWDKTMDGGALNLRRLRNVKDSWIGDVVKVPFTRTMVADDGVTQINLADIAQRIVENRVSGGVMVLPSERDEKGDPLCEYQGPTSVTSSTGIDDWIHDLDNDILDGLLIPREVMEAATSGSGYSGRAFPMRTFLSLRDREFSEYVRAINRAIIAPMVAQNFGLPFTAYDLRPVSLNETLKDDVRPQYMMDRQQQQEMQSQRSRDAGADGLQFSVDDDMQFAVEHAPEGGISIAGKQFKGGEFIPKAYQAKMTQQQREKIDKSNGSDAENNGVTVTAKKGAVIAGKYFKKGEIIPERYHNSITKRDEGNVIVSRETSTPKNSHPSGTGAVRKSNQTNGGREHIFYRAASNDSSSPGYSFASKQEDAQSYLDNPGFGGHTLYKVKANVYDEVDFTSHSPWRDLEDAIGENIDPERYQSHFASAITASDKIRQKLISAGFSWVKFVDDYPEGCVTYVPLTQEAADSVEFTELKKSSDPDMQFSADSENPKANSINQQMAGVASAFQNQIQASIRGLLKKNDMTRD